MGKKRWTSESLFASFVKRGLLDPSTSPRDLDGIADKVFVALCPTMYDATVKKSDSRKLFGLLTDELQRQVAEGVDLTRLAWRFEGVAKVAHPAIDRADRLRFLECTVRACPYSVTLRVRLGDALLDVGRHEEAIATLERALSLDPENRDAKRLIEVCRRDRST